MIEQYAPAGKVWFCMMCGKITKDCYGEERGWDESCVLNCILVDEATKRPTELQAQEFSKEHERRLSTLKSEFHRLIQEMRDGTPQEFDAETMKLAQEAANAVERRAKKAKSKNTTRG